MAPSKPLRDPGVLSFNAVILHGEHSACRLVEFPFSAEELFGRRGNIDAVKCTFNGETSPGPLYRRGGDGGHILLLRKALREKLGVSVGDEVAVTVRLAKRSAASAKAPPKRNKAPTESTAIVSGSLNGGAAGPRVRPAFLRQIKGKGER